MLTARAYAERLYTNRVRVDIRQGGLYLFYTWSFLCLSHRYFIHGAYISHTYLILFSYETHTDLIQKSYEKRRFPGNYCGHKQTETA